MPNFMAFFLNRSASSPGNKPGEILNSLPLEAGTHAADIGSGGGYFTLQFARKVGPGGRVYAIDTIPKNLETVKRQAEKAGLNTVIPVLAGSGPLSIPALSLDLVFLRDVFHHLSDQVEYFAKLKPLLKPSARIAVIDYRKKGGLDFTTLTGHYTEEEVILEKMQRAGYAHIQRLTFLPRQSFNIFKMDE